MESFMIDINNTMAKAIVMLYIHKVVSILYGSLLLVIGLIVALLSMNTTLINYALNTIRGNVIINARITQKECL